MKTIPLTKDKYAIVDDCDFESLSKHKWGLGGQFWGKAYAARNTVCEGKQKTILMHRQIMDAPVNLWVDHINGNGFDNRRINLRLCTRNQNLSNRKVHSNNKAGIKGVRRVGARWEARIQSDKKTISIGRFGTSCEAAIAYNEAAVRFHGEFASLNPI